LKSIGISDEIIKNFAENDICGSILLDLNESDLTNDLGVKSLGMRKKNCF